MGLLDSRRDGFVKQNLERLMAAMHPSLFPGMVLQGLQGCKVATFHSERIVAGSHIGTTCDYPSGLVLKLAWVFREMGDELTHGERGA
jgi:hypothetical protein